MLRFGLERLDLSFLKLIAIGLLFIGLTLTGRCPVVLYISFEQGAVATIQLLIGFCTLGANGIGSDAILKEFLDEIL